MFPLLSFSTALMVFCQPFSLEKSKILEAREKSISSMYCKFSVDGLNTHLHPNGSYSRAYQVWYSGGRTREDLIQRDGQLAGERQICCEGCEQKDLFLGFFTTKSRSFALEKIKGELPESSRPSDPRKLGYVLNDYFGFRYVRLDAILNLPGMREPTVESVPLDGMECRRYSWAECANRWKPTVWVSPTQGNNIARIEVASPDFQGFIRSELALDAASGIWFPKKTHFELKEKGSLTRRETIQVEKVLFNSPDIEAGFYLDNMNLPEGTLVNFPDEMGDAIIRDGKMSRGARTALRDERRPKPPVPIHAPANRTWMLFAILSGLLTLSTMGVVFWRQKSPAQ